MSFPHFNTYSCLHRWKTLSWSKIFNQNISSIVTSYLSLFHRDPSTLQMLWKWFCSQSHKQGFSLAFFWFHVTFLKFLYKLLSLFFFFWLFFFGTSFPYSLFYLHVHILEPLNKMFCVFRGSYLNGKAFTAFHFWPSTSFMSPSVPCSGQVFHIPTHCTFPPSFTLSSQPTMAFTIIHAWSSESRSNAQPQGAFSGRFCKPKWTLFSVLCSPSLLSPNRTHSEKHLFRVWWFWSLGQIQGEALVPTL